MTEEKQTLEILVGDDLFQDFLTERAFDDLVTAQLKEKLPEYEIKITKESTVESTIHEVESGKYKVVVTDLDYEGTGKGKEGFEVIDRAYSLSPRPLTILFTGSDCYDEIKERTEGKIDYLCTGKKTGHKFGDLRDTLIEHYSKKIIGGS